VTLSRFLNLVKDPQYFMPGWQDHAGRFILPAIVFSALQPRSFADRKLIAVHAFHGGCREIPLRQLPPRDQADADYRGAQEVLWRALWRTLETARVAIAGHAEGGRSCVRIDPLYIRCRNVFFQQATD
jgi:hypothetical protein